MAETNITEELNKYKYAGLAGMLIENDPLSAGISLEKLAKDLGMPEDARGFIDGTLASEEGIKYATNMFAKKYADAYAKATIEDLWDYYLTNADLSDGEKLVYGAKIKLSLGLKPKDIQEKLKSAQEKMKNVLDGKETLNESQISQLTQEITQYREIIGLIGNLEQYNILTLSEPVEKEARKKKKKELKKTMGRIVGV